MSLQKVRDEIECMRRIVEILKEMETERSRKFENCLPDSMSAVGVGKTPLLRHQRPHHDHIVPTPRLLIFGGEQAKNTSSRLHKNHLLPDWADCQRFVSVIRSKKFFSQRLAQREELIDLGRVEFPFQVRENGKPATFF